MIYLASSWRNRHFDNLFESLIADGHDVYNFKAGAAFNWNQVGIDSNGESFETYVDGLGKNRAKEGFKADFDALRHCSTCLLILPCGRSAHLELGYACGAFNLMGVKPHTAIWFPPDEDVTPELMYRMVDKLSNNWSEIREWLKEGEGIGS